MTDTTIVSRPARSARRLDGIPLRIPGRLCPEAAWLWAAVAAFVAGSAWWCAHDDRVPDWDSGVHMGFAIIARDELLHGRIAAPWDVYTTYPPLQHLVGAIILLVGGLQPSVLLLGANLVFVPLLAFGCYGTGKTLAGPKAGLLAGLVALGTPMFVSEMHMYEPDPEQAAMVAVAVWALLASQHFRRPGISAMAGMLAGLAMLTKETSVVFLAGPVLVTAVRGGRRSRNGLTGFLVWLLLIAAPWYAFHFHQMLGTFGSIAELVPNPAQAPPRLSWANAGWYLWDLLNQQTLAVVGGCFLIGLVIALGRCRRPLRSGNLYPELVAGALVSYIGMSLLTHKDPRYTLPALVYVAVLATAWIATLTRRRLRRVLSAGLVLNAAVLFAGMTFGLGGGPVRFGLPHSPATLIYPRQVTLYETSGWIRGGPKRDGAVLSLLRGMHQDGIRRVSVDTGADGIDFNFPGIQALAMMSGLQVTETRRASSGADAFLFVHRPRSGDPSPCQTLLGGEGVYVAVGEVGGMRPTVGNLSPRRRLICP